MPLAMDYNALADFRFELRRFLDFSEQAARQAGLEPHQHQALLALKAFEGSAAPDIGELSRRLLIRHHSAVELTDRLETRGLVHRSHSHADRRQVLLRLTPRGRTLLERVSRLHIRMLCSEGTAFLRALRRVIRHARAAARKQPGKHRARRQNKRPGGMGSAAAHPVMAKGHS
jgi:DNA-binding MarR family transcriptional regulator